MRLACIGTVTIDTINKEGAVFKAPGGTSFFASLALAALRDSATIITSHGDDWKPFEDRLSSYGVEVVNLNPGGSTTKFKIDYGERGRRLSLISPATPLDLDPSELREYDGILLGPVARELSRDFAIHSISSGSFTAVGIQGYVRGFGTDGRVYAQRTDLSFLRGSYLVGGSSAEFRAALGDARFALGIGSRYVLMSRGRAGATLYGTSKWHAKSSGNGSDPTGAGDVLLASSFHNLLSGMKETDAIARATALASASAHGSGFQKFELIRRAAFSRRSSVYLYDIPIAQLVRFPHLLPLIGHASPNPGILKVLCQRPVQCFGNLTNGHL